MKTGLKVLAVVLVTGLAAALLAVYGGPHLIERQLQGFFSAQSDQTLVIEETVFNPLTLSARLQGLSLNEADGTPVLTVASTRLSFRLSALLQRQIILKEVTLERPDLTIELSSTPDITFRTLVDAFSPAEEAARAIPMIRIEQGIAHGGTLRVRVESQSGKLAALQQDTAAPYEVLLGDATLEFGNFDNKSDEPADFAMTTQLNGSATISARGKFRPVTSTLEASVQLMDLELARLGPPPGTGASVGQMSGVMSGNGTFSHGEGGSHFAGELGILQLSAHLGADGQADFIAEELIIQGADIRTMPVRASARYVSLRRPRIDMPFDFPGDSIGAMKALGWPPGIDELVISDGQASIGGLALANNTRMELSDINGAIFKRSTGPSKTVRMQLAGTMNQTSPVTINSVFRYVSEPAQSDPKPVAAGHLRGELGVRHADASLLSAYFAPWSARDIDSGSFDLDLGYHIEAGTISMTCTALLRDLLLGKPSGFAPSENMQLELATALLTDPAGEMKIEIPVKRPSGESASSILETALSEYFSTVAERPFSLLAELVGAEEGALNAIVFQPGSAAITADAEWQLHLLNLALRERPTLGLLARGGYSRQADGAALARRQMVQHVTLAASTRPNNRQEQDTVDFADPKVQAVLSEFAQARLEAGQLKRLNDRWRPHGGADTATPESSGYFERLFEALVAKEPVPDKALRKLAQFRAQSVVRQLTDLGVVAGRLRLDQDVSPAEGEDPTPAVELVVDLLNGTVTEGI